MTDKFQENKELLGSLSGLRIDNLKCGETSAFGKKYKETSVWSWLAAYLSDKSLSHVKLLKDETDFLIHDPDADFSLTSDTFQSFVTSFEGEFECYGDYNLDLCSCVFLELLEGL